MVLTSTHNLCFEQKYEKDQSFFFLSENVQFLEAKFSIYLNRRLIHLSSSCLKIFLNLSVELDL